MAREHRAQIMIQIIDQRWRQHLVEMDYLREGIHLRGIAQTDPLVAWQREGFEMFGKLMDSIDDDYLRYVMHVKCVAEPAEEPDYAQATFVAAEEPGPTWASLPGRGRAAGGEAARVRAQSRRAGTEPGQRRRRARRRRQPLRGGSTAPAARLAAGRRADRADWRRKPADRRPRSGGTSRAGAEVAQSSSSATARAERPWLEPPTTPARRRRAPAISARCWRLFAPASTLPQGYLRLDELIAARSSALEARGRRARNCGPTRTMRGR